MDKNVINYHPWTMVFLKRNFLITIVLVGKNDKEELKENGIIYHYMIIIDGMVTILQSSTILVTFLA